MSFNKKREISKAGTSGQKRVKISDKQPEVRIIDDTSLEDNANTNQFVEYDDIAHTEDQEEEAKMKKIQKQEEEDFSGDEEDYQEMIRKRKVIKHFAAEEEYADGKTKEDNLSKADLEENVNGITRFNLKEENEEGYFDGNGDFVWKKNKDEEEINQDAYMREIDKIGIASIPDKTPAKEEKIFSQNMVFVRLCSCLQDSETPMEAIHRLGQTNQKKKSKSQRHQLPFERMQKEISLSPEQIQLNKKIMDLLSECCSILLEEYVNIYEMKKEDLKRLVIINYSTAKKQWEYKWQVQADGSAGESEVYSSFNTAQMVEWHEMGCFISNPLIRRVEEKPKEEKTGFTTDDFDAGFDEDENEPQAESQSNPWIPAEEIDYFED